MKRILALVLCAITVFSMAACGKKTETPAATAAKTDSTTQQPATQVPGPEKVEKKDYSEFAGIVADPKTWYENFMNLPIASADMTEDQLRQLCVDAFKANLTFHWTPNLPISYTYTLSGKTSEVLLPMGIAYSGLAYATGQSSGHLYKILQYYDLETGVLDVEAMDSNKVRSIITSACARGAEQGWNRVSDNHGIGSMDTFNQYDSNMVLVGPYTYECSDYNYDFGSRTATSEIIEKNGAEIMYESYARMKPADGLYSSPSWHVMMCSSVPVVVRNSAGKIDPEQSYMLVLEQDAVGTKTEKRDVPQDNGVILRQLGGVDHKYTFKKLLDKGYIPFTLKEFTGEEPVEPGEVWLGTQKEKLPREQSLTVQELSTKTLYGNYALVLLELQVKDPQGQVLLSWIPDFVTLPTTHSVTLQGTLEPEVLKPYCDGKNTLHISARLANGELLEAFSAVLKM